ncbi:hypothetical protein VP01_177g2 [Puccinia sorghi]|uniref:Uncharacterized protein n=1 Tax=Puccinia sorghi TaxID=27349 RepID=A0A0L6VEP5_9BASI|nr:hypothetical protein VP01_177g2 [Puccinia sorghi]
MEGRKLIKLRVERSPPWLPDVDTPKTLFHLCNTSTLQFSLVSSWVVVKRPDRRRPVWLPLSDSHRQPRSIHDQPRRLATRNISAPVLMIILTTLYSESVSTICQPRFSHGGEETIGRLHSNNISLWRLILWNYHHGSYICGGFPGLILEVSHSHSDKRLIMYHDTLHQVEVFTSPNIPNLDHMFPTPKLCWVVTIIDNIQRDLEPQLDDFMLASVVKPALYDLVTPSGTCQGNLLSQSMSMENKNRIELVIMTVNHPNKAETYRKREADLQRDAREPSAALIDLCGYTKTKIDYGSNSDIVTRYWGLPFVSASTHSWGIWPRQTLSRNLGSGYFQSALHEFWPRFNKKNTLRLHNYIIVVLGSGSLCCYSNFSPRLIQPSFDAKSLCRLHSDCEYAACQLQAVEQFFFAVKGGSSSAINTIRYLHFHCCVFICCIPTCKGNIKTMCAHCLHFVSGMWRYFYTPSMRAQDVKCIYVHAIHPYVLMFEDLPELFRPFTIALRIDTSSRGGCSYDIIREKIHRRRMNQGNEGEITHSTKTEKEKKNYKSNNKGT